MDRIGIGFTIDSEHGSYTDTLWFESMSDYEAQIKNIEAMKQDRYNNWLKAITAPEMELVSDPIEQAKQTQSEAQDMAVQAMNAAQQALEALLKATAIVTEGG